MLASSRSTASSWFTTRLDDSLPFWPAWVWIYLSAYFLDSVGLCLAVRGVSDKIFRTMLIACYVNLFVASLFHISLPFEAMKPEIATTTLSGAALAFVQKLTTRWNTFPSLHVSYSLITLWAAAKGFEKHKLTSVLLIANALLIIPATLFVKEHTVLDVCGGAIVAALSLIVAMGFVSADGQSAWYRFAGLGKVSLGREPADRDRETETHRIQSE